MRVLITGGAGYIGSHIIELLVKKNFNTFIINSVRRLNSHNFLIIFE